MGESNWRHRLGRIPVLGNLAAGLRGVYSLRAWRASLRQDITDLRRDLQTITDRIEELRGELQSQQDRLPLMLDERDAQARDRLMQAREEDRADREAWMRATDARLTALIERSERRAAADLVLDAQRQAALGQLRAMLRESQRSVGLPGVPPIPGSQAASAPTASDTEALASLPTVPIVPAANALAALADDEDAASWREWLTPLAADAQVVVLADEKADEWTPALQAVAPESLGGIAVPMGARGLDAAAMRALALAAAAALAPGAGLAIRLDNPENAVVAAALCQAGPGVTAWTPDALTQVLSDAGFAEVAVWRLDANDTVIVGEGEALAALNRLLAGPRRFIAVATRGD